MAYPCRGVRVPFHVLRRSMRGIVARRKTYLVTGSAVCLCKDHAVITTLRLSENALASVLAWMLVGVSP